MSVYRKFVLQKMLLKGYELAFGFSGGPNQPQPTTQPTSTPQPIPPANSAGYHSSRAEAVQSVQKTIGELAQMFQKFLGRDKFFFFVPTNRTKKKKHVTPPATIRG